MSNWIKTTDRMPEDDTFVLFTIGHGCIWLGTWNEYSEEWCDDSVCTTVFTKEEVIAWCPIPEYDIKD